jgi:hypothetical protein
VRGRQVSWFRRGLPPRGGALSRLGLKSRFILNARLVLFCVWFVACHRVESRVSTTRDGRWRLVLKTKDFKVAASNCVVGRGSREPNLTCGRLLLLRLVALRRSFYGLYRGNVQFWTVDWHV